MALLAELNAQGMTIVLVTHEARHRGVGAAAHRLSRWHGSSRTAAQSPLPQAERSRR